MSTTPPAPKPTLKERIENYAPFIFASAVFAGFVAGYGVHSAVSASPLFGSSASVDWQETARGKGWIPKSDCEATPLKLRILGPGDEATIETNTGYLEPEIVVSASHPIPKLNTVGIVYNVDGQNNFYVEFPSWNENDQRTVFRKFDPLLDLHDSTAGKKRMTIWALVAEDEKAFGSVYGSLDQIKAVSDGIFLSEKITINVVETK